jgi:2-amino-4-hydroxy-6-hydroxymethyldihydropteridine diphosphokinase
MKKKYSAYLLLGSNLGDKKSNLARAIQLLEARTGKASRVSSLYETAPWGVGELQPDYYNQALAISTTLTPEELLQTVLQIEKEMGRERTSPNAPRTIDIDILLYDNVRIQTKALEIPHPRLHLRNFALIPLMEIAGQELHPVFQKSIEELYFDSTDESEVILLD